MARSWVAVGLFMATVALTLALGRAPHRAELVQGPLYQPDLIIAGIADAQRMDCRRPAGINVTVRNDGAGAAGASVTRLSAGGAGLRLLDTPALGPTGQVTLYSSLTGIPSGDTYSAQADYANDVTESNENNNSLSQYLVLATLPTCTPPPPTITPTPTAANTATPTPTSTCDPLAGDADKNGDVSAVDAALVLQYSARLISSINPRADASGDGEIDAIDAFFILQLRAGLLFCLPPDVIVQP